MLQAGDIEIVVVKSSDNSYFRQSIETLIGHIDRQARIDVVMVTELDKLPAAAPSERLYIGFGALAAGRIIQLGESGAILAYLTREQMLEFGADDHLHVLLDQPLYRYLAFARLLLAIDSIGVIGETPLETGEVEQRILDEFALQLRQYKVDERYKLLPLLRDLLQQNDALLMLPRRSIYNRDSLKGVLLTSYRYRKPAISYSPAHVKAGALASVYSSPTDIGRHLALLVNRRLEDPSWQWPAFEYARFYTISTNRRVARSLSLDLPGEDEIRRQLDRIAP